MVVRPLNILHLLNHPDLRFVKQTSRPVVQTDNAGSISRLTGHRRRPNRSSIDHDFEPCVRTRQYFILLQSCVLPYQDAGRYQDDESYRRQQRLLINRSKHAHTRNDSGGFSVRTLTSEYTRKSPPLLFAVRQLRNVSFETFTPSPLPNQELLTLLVDSSQ